MVFFFNWLFGSRQVKEDAKYFSKAASFKIAAHDFVKFNGKPEHWYAFRNKTLSTLGVAGFSSIRQSRIRKATAESTMYLKVQPMMVQPLILSEDTKKREMGGLLGML